jgi:SEC-C motif
MKHPGEVKPFFIHPEPIIRRFVLRYFDEMESTDSELMPLVLQAFRMSSDNDGRTLLALSNGFTQTRETMEAIVGLIMRRSRHWDLCERLFISSSPSLIAEFSSCITKLSPRARTIARKRMSFASMDTDLLFRQLVEHSERGKGLYIGEFDYYLGVYMARELARRPDAPVDAIQQWIDTEYPTDYDGYEDIYGCVLAGFFQLEHTVPRLISYLHREGDLLNEEAARALTRIASPKTADLIRQDFSSADWHFRLFAGGVLGTIKHPASEEAILELLPSEDDDSIRTVLAEGLCNLLSVKGIPIVKQVISDGYDEMMLDLVEPLYANCVINGLDLPELPEWKAHVEEAEQARWERLNSMKNGRGWNGSNGSRTVVKAVKVGRNDPCPCGSGKKYKKCCGR